MRIRCCRTDKIADRKCIISHAVGTDHIDLAYCREANIQVMTCTGCNTESVAEHALSLYFATRRSLVSVHNTLADFEPGRPNEWKSKGECITRNGAPLSFSPMASGKLSWKRTGLLRADLLPAKFTGRNDEKSPLTESQAA